jgi:hypothetical protein
MSAPERPGPVKDWLFVEKLLGDEELDRIDKLSDKQVEDEMRARGMDPAQVPSAEKLLKGAEERAGAGARGGAQGTAKVVPLRRRVIQWGVGLALAAGFLLVVARSFGPDGGVASGWHGTPEGRERAAKLRNEAYSACGAQQWKECLGKLDEAKDVDPEGERDPRVIEARKAIEMAGGG